MKLSLGRIVVICALVVNAAIVGTGLYMAFWPMTVIEVKSQDCGGFKAKDCILNPNKTVTVGRTLIYKISYCKLTRTQAAVSRSLKGANVTYPMPPSTNNVPTGCTTAISRNTIIPVGVEPGAYRLELSATYRVNPLRFITVTHESEPFTVVKDTSDATSSSLSAPSSVDDQSNTTTSVTLHSAPTQATVPFGTDPVTQEPTQPATTPAPTASPAPTPQPGLVPQIIQRVNGLLGL